MLTLKRDHFKRTIVFQPSSFRGYVSFFFGEYTNRNGLILGRETVVYKEHSSLLWWNLLTQKKCVLRTVDKKAPDPNRQHPTFVQTIGNFCPPKNPRSQTLNAEIQPRTIKNSNSSNMRPRLRCWHLSRLGCRCS